MSISLALLACACPGRVPAAGEGEGEGEGEVPVASPQELTDAFVAFVDRCGPLVFGPVGEQEPTFLARVLEMMRANLPAATLDRYTRSTVLFDGARARACIDALEAADPSSCALDASVIAECAGVTTGTRDEGEACAFSAECTGENVCTGIFPAFGGFRCGVCQPGGQEGERCPCASGLACTGPSVCIAPRSDGDPCVLDACGSDALVCVDGSCRPVDVRGPGEPCDSPTDHCVDSMTKNGCLPNEQGDLVCTPWPSTGDDCSESFFCDSTVGYCDFETGICVEGGGEGDACRGGDTECQIAFDCVGPFPERTCSAGVEQPGVPLCE